jgi:hypothetical protein
MFLFILFYHIYEHVVPPSPTYDLLTFQTHHFPHIGQLTEGSLYLNGY